MHLSSKSLAVLTVAVCLGTAAARGEGWSLNPFAGSQKSSTTHTVNRSQQEPSMLQKMGTGTKEFFGRVGNVVTPHKSPPKKSTRQTSRTKTSKKKSSSWFGSLFAPKEPEPPHSLSEWMELEPIRP
jgi:hypothetical protein